MGLHPSMLSGHNQPSTDSGWSLIVSSGTGIGSHTSVMEHKTMDKWKPPPNGWTTSICTSKSQRTYSYSEFYREKAHQIHVQSSEHWKKTEDSSSRQRLALEEP